MFKARKADSAAPKLEPKPPPAISVVVRLLTNKSSSSSLMVEPLIAATQVFDHMQQPDSPGVEQALSLLLPPCWITTIPRALRHSAASAQRCVASGLD